MELDSFASEAVHEHPRSSVGPGSNQSNIPKADIDEEWVQSHDYKRRAAKKESPNCHRRTSSIVRSVPSSSLVSVMPTWRGTMTTDQTTRQTNEQCSCFILIKVVRYRYLVGRQLGETKYMMLGTQATIRLRTESPSTSCAKPSSLALIEISAHRYIQRDDDGRRGEDDDGE